MAKTLPPYGDMYLGDNPWAVRTDELIVYLSGRNTSAVAYGTDVDSDDVSVALASASVTSESLTNLWVLPAGMFVYGMWASVTDSWGADSDGAQFSIGDTAGADTWFTDTLLLPNHSTDGGVFKSNALAPPAGKFYDTGATIAITWEHATSTLASGLMKLVLVYSMAR